MCNINLASSIAFDCCWCCRWWELLPPSTLAAAAEVDIYTSVGQGNMPKALRHDTVMTALVSSMATVLWYMMMCLCLSLGNAIFSTPHLWGPRPAMSSNSTCDDWVEWIPPVSDPAVVMQVRACYCSGGVECEMPHWLVPKVAL